MTTACHETQSRMGMSARTMEENLSPIRSSVMPIPPMPTRMPSGMPVATVAIDGAANAALLAAQILAVEDETMAEKLLAMRKAQHDAVIAKDAALVVE